MIEIIGLDGRDFSDRCHAPNLGILAVRFEVDGLGLLEERLDERGYAADGGRRPLSLPPWGDFDALNVRSPDGALIQFLAPADSP